MACRLFDWFAVYSIDDGRERSEASQCGAAHAVEGVKKQAIVQEGLEYARINLSDDQRSSIKAFAPFVFPKLRVEQKRNILAPLKYVVTLTGENGRRKFGFCVKMLPRSPGTRRYDLNKRYPEVLCIASDRYEVDLYDSILDFMVGRRLVDLDSFESFVSDIFCFSPVPDYGKSFRFSNHSLGVLYDYNFVRPRLHEEADLLNLLLCFQRNTLYLLMGAVMCEHRIILMSRRETAISNVIHAIISLLQPFKWLHMFIPLLPEHLLDYLAAPNPYLVGVLKEYQSRLDQICLRGAVIFDLDSQTIRYTTREVIHAFGPAQSDRFIKLRGDGGLFGEFGSAISGLFLQAKRKDPNVECQLRAAWFAIYIRLFGTTTDFFSSIDGTVDKIKFVQAVQDQDARVFLESFVHTQMFNHFAETQSTLARTFSTEKATMASEFGTYFDSLFRKLSRLLRSEDSFADMMHAASAHFAPRLRSPNSTIANVIFQAVNFSPQKSAATRRVTLGSTFANISRRTYDSIFAHACMYFVFRYIQDGSIIGSKNSLIAFRSMLLLEYLISAGSEAVVASAMANLKSLLLASRLHKKTKLSWIARFRNLARRINGNLLDLGCLEFERSPNGGHRIFFSDNSSKQDAAFESLRIKDACSLSFADFHELVSFNNRSAPPPKIAHFEKPTPPVPPKTYLAQTKTPTSHIKVSAPKRVSQTLPNVNGGIPRFSRPWRPDTHGDSLKQQSARTTNKESALKKPEKTLEARNRNISRRRPRPPAPKLPSD